MKIALFVAALLTLVFAGPIKHHRSDLASSEQRCASQCSGSETKYNFQTGSTYTYQFTSHTDVQISHVDGHASNVSQRATIEIAKLADCEYQMQIRQLKVTGADVPQKFESHVTKHAIRFAFDDGVLSTVCADSDDLPWVVNLKRGFLSTLQNAFQSDEMDVNENEVAGECRARYSHRRSGDDTIYTRQRHTHSCRSHHNMHGAMKTHVYHSDQGHTFGEHAHHCEHRVNAEGILREARCTETQKFMPIADDQQNTGIQSTVRSHWKLIDQINTAKIVPIHFGKQESIIYDSSSIDYNFDSTNARDVQSALKALCDSSDNFVAKSTPSEFIHLVETLRKLNDDDWSQFDQHRRALPDCENSIKFMRDALAMCGTDKCVQEIVSLLKSDELSDREQLEFFASLAFVPKVTLGMVKSVTPLFQKGRHGLLGVSSLVHSFCVQNKINACDSVPEVEKIIDQLLDIIGRSCDVSNLDPKRMEEKILAVKALGNIGHLTNAGQSTIEKCIVERANPISMRVAAVQATRRTPCDAKIRTILRKLYANENEEVELRINAFMSMMKCGDEETIEYAIDVLNQEQVQQVGAFVTSFLKERRASTDPQVREMTNKLRSIRLPTTFDGDRSRFSSYSEMGSFRPADNIGSHVETGLIYVPGSFTPRAAFANISAHLFGHSVNFIELGARAEGLDHIIDNQFGTEGALTNPTGSDFDSELIKNSAEYLQQQKDFESRVHYESDEKFALSMYVRVFGDEIIYLGFDDPNIMNSMRVRHDKKIFSDFMGKKRDFNYKQNALFMDITKALPNAGGLPVFLKITGASSVNIGVDGKTDLADALSTNMNVNIDWTVKPSMAIELSTTLYIDVGGMKNGYQLLSRIHSSTALNGKFQVQNGRTIKAVLGLPQDNMKIVDFEINGIGLANNKPMQTTDDTYYQNDEYCTPERFNSLLGVKTCMGISKPKQGRFIPARAWLGIDKTDAKLKTYEIELKLRQGRGIPYPEQLTFDTPGSIVDRKLMLRYEQDGELHVLEAQTPAKHLKLEGKLAMTNFNSGKSYKGDMNLIVDKNKEYKMMTTIKRQFDGEKMITSMHAQTQTDTDPIDIVGKLEFGGLSDVLMNGKVVGINDEPTSIALNLKLPKSGYTGMAIFEAQYQSPEYDNQFEARYTNEEPNYKLKFNTHVKPGVKSNFEPMTARFDIEHEETMRDNQITIRRKLELVKSIHPKSNFILTNDAITSSTYRKYGVDLKYGNELTQEANVVVESHYKHSGKQIYEGKIRVPSMNIENKIDAVYDRKTDDNRFDIKANAQLTDVKTNNKMTIDMHHVIKTRKPYIWTIDLTAKADNPDIDMRFFKQLTEKADSTEHQKKFDSELIVKWATAKQVQFNGDISLSIADISYDKMDYSLKGKATLTGVKINDQSEFDVEKTIKHSNDHYIYKAKLSHKEKPYYDLLVDFNNQEKSKNLKSAIKSYLSDNIDYGMNVKVEEPQSSHYFVEATWLCASKNCAQLKTQYTPNYKNNKVSLYWDMNTEMKMLTIDMQRDDEPKNVKYLATIVANVNQQEHKLIGNIDLEKQDHMNFKATLIHNKDKKKSIGAEFGQDNGNHRVQYWAKYQADDPELTKRDIELKFAADLNALSSDSSRSHASIGIEFHDNIDRSNNIVAQLKSSHKNADKLAFYNYINIEAFDIYKLRQETDVTNLNLDVWQYQHDTEYEQNTLLQWANDKKIERKMQCKHSLNNGRRSTVFDDSIVTPFDGYRQYSTNVAYDRDENEKKKTAQLSVELQFNNERVIKAVSLNEFDKIVGRLSNHQSTISTRYEHVGDVKIQYENDHKDVNGLPVYCLDASIDWATVNKLHFRREYGWKVGKSRYLAMWTAKIDGRFDTKARYDYHLTDTEHRLEASLKNSDDQYSLTAKFDDGQQSGTMKIVAPNTPIESAVVRVDKIGDNEYQLSTDGSGGTRIAGTIKATTNHMRAHLKLDGIVSPIEIEAEIKDPQSDNSIGKLVIVKNYNSAATAHKMGVTFERRMNNNFVDSDNNRGNMHHKSITIYSGNRESHFELRRGNSAHIAHYAIVAQLDRLSEREPTKLLLRLGSHHSEFELVDASLPKPIVVRFERKQAHECPQFYQRQTRCMSQQLNIAILPPSPNSNNDKIELNLYNAMIIDDVASHIRKLFAIECKQMSSKHHQVYYVEMGDYTMNPNQQSSLSNIPNDEIILTKLPNMVEVGIQIENEARALHKYAVQARVPTTENTGALSLITPSGRQSIEYNHIDDECRWSLIGAEKNQPSYTVALRREQERVVLELRRTPTSSIVYHTSIGLIDQRTFEENTYHIDSKNQKHQDIFAKLWLETDSLLKLRLHVPPASWQNLLQEIKNINWQNKYTDSLLTDLSTSNQHLVDELTKIRPQLETLAENWRNEQQSLRDDIGAGADLMLIVDDLLQYFVDTYNLKVQQLSAIVEDLQKDSKISENIDKMLNSIQESIQSAVEFVGQMFQSVSRSIADGLTAFGETIGDATTSLNKFYDDNDIVGPIQAKLTELIQYVREQLGLMPEHEGFFTRQYHTMKSRLGYTNQHTSALMQFASVRRLYSLIEPAIDELMSFDVQSIIERLIDYVDELTTGKALREYLPKVSYASQAEGEIELQMPLPIRAATLKDLADQVVSMEQAKRIANDVQEKIVQMFETDSKISDDKWRRVGYRTAPSNIGFDYMQSHRVAGYILADQLVTFDGRAYGIRTSCDYILARDFYKNKFTIVGRFARDGIDEIALKYKKIMVSVAVNGKFKVNGQEQTLPYHYVDEFSAIAFIQAIRTDRSIVISTYDSIEIECRLDTSLCSITLPGQYYGHSNGLLGTNDLEHSNDFDLDDDQDNEDVSRFVDQWLVGGGQCRAAVLPKEGSVADAQIQECEKVLRYRRSPMRACFNRVAPKAYHQLCVNGDFCSAMIAYQTACQKLDVAIQMPSQCVRCNNPTKPNGQMFVGDSTDQFTITDKNADVVMIVEERPCMAFLSERLFDDVNPLPSEFKSRNNKFGVVGFGGEEVHNKPHFHTCSSNEVQCSKSSIRTAIDSLEFEPVSATSLDRPIDPLLAIDYAVRHYPWRPKAAKIIVLFTCTECGSKVDYYQLQAAMLSQNVQLFVYTKEMIEIEDQASDLEIQGFSADTLFTNKGDKPDLRRLLTSPHDSCTVLAQELNGTVFSLYDDQSSAVKRSGVINAQRTRYPNCQICACEQTTSPKANCVSCEVPTPASLTDASFFNIPYVRLRNTIKKTQEQIVGLPTFLL